MGVKKKKSMSPIIKYFNDIKDYTPKYSCICCQIQWFKHQVKHIIIFIRK